MIEILGKDIKMGLCRNCYHKNNNKVRCKQAQLMAENRRRCQFFYPKCKVKKSILKTNTKMTPWRRMKA